MTKMNIAEQSFISDLTEEEQKQVGGGLGLAFSSATAYENYKTGEASVRGGSLAVVEKGARLEEFQAIDTPFGFEFRLRFR